MKKELLYRYEMEIRYNNRYDLKDKALAIGERLVAESGDYFVVSSAKNSMASIHEMLGNYDEAKRIIDSLPFVYNLDIFDRMRCSASVLTGKDRLNGAREFKVWAQQDLFICCGQEGRGFWEIGDYENALLSFKEEAGVIELFRSRKVPEKYTVLGTRIGECEARVKIAACLYKLGKLEECNAMLECALQLLKEEFSEDFWTENYDYCMKFYRNPYHEFELDEYKTCL